MDITGFTRRRTIKIKKGVKINGLRPELSLALQIADGIYNNHKTEMVITSVVDGVHSSNSLHYSGCAADLRIRDLPSGNASLVTKDMSEKLGSDFDVVLERDHIHVEYQPQKT